MANPNLASATDREIQALASNDGHALRDELPSACTYIEFAPEFLGVEDPPVEYLINELLPRRVIALAHGEPRTRKSWAALEIAIALATGTRAFGLDRFSVLRPVPVLYSSQEDGARDVRVRAKALLLGRGITTFPGTLAFAVHKGIYFESAEWQEMLLRDIAALGFEPVVFDPIRRFSTNVDKGPAEVRAITGFLRRLTVETGATIMPVHHDVKPTTDNRDARRRGHKASGGDWFAAAECPIAFESAGENHTLVIPEDYKFSADPQPFKFRVESDDPRQLTKRIHEQIVGGCAPIGRAGPQGRGPELPNPPKGTRSNFDLACFRR